VEKNNFQVHLFPWLSAQCTYTIVRRGENEYAFGCYSPINISVDKTTKTAQCLLKLQLNIYNVSGLFFLLDLECVFKKILSLDAMLVQCML